MECSWCSQLASVADGLYPVDRAFPPGSTRPGVDNGYDVAVCLDCVERHDLERCDGLRCSLHTANYGNGVGGNICQVCIDSGRYIECDHCELYVNRINVYSIGGNRVCEDCELEYYRSCERCDAMYERPDPWGPDSGSEYCSVCRRSVSTLIYDWDYAPENYTFYGDGPVYLGFELEVSVPDIDECAEYVNGRLGEHGFLKEDGTVDGFEIVTQPMTYEYTLDHYPWDMLRWLRSQGCSGYDHGLHVHVSREGFAGDAHRFRWLKLWYRNADAIRPLARRDSDQWASWGNDIRKNAKHYSKEDGSIPPAIPRAYTHNHRPVESCGCCCVNCHDELARQSTGCGQPRFRARRVDWANAPSSRQMVAPHPERYSAINCQNDATYEVRIFRSTLQPYEVKTALALVDATVEYTRTLTVPEIRDGGWEWNAFLVWLEDQDHYGDLLDATEEQREEQHAQAELRLNADAAADEPSMADVLWSDDDAGPGCPRLGGRASDNDVAASADTSAYCLFCRSHIDVERLRLCEHTPVSDYGAHRDRRLTPTRYEGCCFSCCAINHGDLYQQRERERYIASRY